jgi:hypothetical protein
MLTRALTLFLLAGLATAEQTTTPPASTPAPAASPLTTSGAPQARGGEAKPAEAAAAPAARPEDVKTIDSIMAAVYDVISGPAGQKRDWDRFRSLFAPGARLIPLRHLPDGKWMPAVLTPEDYITRGGPGLERDGFFENEISRTTERYDNIVQAFSSYESRRKKEDQPFARGINSFQLAYDGTRWWVVTIYWRGETPDATIPKEYLPKK